MKGGGPKSLEICLYNMWTAPKVWHWNEWIMNIQTRSGFEKADTRVLFEKTRVGSGK